MTRPDRSRRSWHALASRGSRFASLLVALALLVSHIGRLSHALLVHHSVCAPGDLVHADHGEERAAPSTSGDSPRAHGAPSSGDSDHDHCDAASLAHRLELPDAPIPAASMIARLPSGEMAAAERRPRTPLEIAPKASPPRCG